DRRRGLTRRFAFDVGVAVVSLLLSVAFVYSSRNTGDTWYVVWGPFLMAGGASLLGIPVYLRMRGSMTAPEPVPAYR
ncbi:MAG: amino acid permease, partial [Marmoricola sp.]|nr:amino acid permease [Marmoricola sp.]